MVAVAQHHGYQQAPFSVDEQPAHSAAFGQAQSAVSSPISTASLELALLQVEPTKVSNRGYATPLVYLLLPEIAGLLAPLPLAAPTMKYPG
mmetsp:Transcript_85752/g.156236  ORF Transcript_85752/g.156236 Transcript_85752/m.156236 type:complete len:91 (-) Transcript_85752:437-709(-)